MVRYWDIFVVFSVLLLLFFAPYPNPKLSTRTVDIETTTLTGENPMFGDTIRDFGKGSVYHIFLTAEDIAPAILDELSVQYYFKETHEFLSECNNVPIRTQFSQPEMELTYEATHDSFPGLQVCLWLDVPSEYSSDVTINVQVQVVDEYHLNELLSNIRSIILVYLLIRILYVASFIEPPSSKS